MERHEVCSHSNPDWPMSAIRLVLANEIVRQALEFSDRLASNPVLASA